VLGVQPLAKVVVVVGELERGEVFSSAIIKRVVF
jgi:hypothetical protein